MMRRIPNWDIALHKWAAEVTGKPYVWGETDCGSLVRAAHRVMYGVDVFEDVPLYKTSRSAARRHAQTGGIAAALRNAGAIEVAASFVQQGDVLIEEDGDRFPAAGVVVGGTVIWATVEDGVTRSPVRGRSGTLLRIPHG